MPTVWIFPFQVMRKNVPYITVSQNDEGIDPKTSEFVEYPNVLVSNRNPMPNF